MPVRSALRSAALLLVAGCAPMQPGLPGPPPGDWRTFEEPDCGFRVDMPGPPQHVTRQRPGGGLYRRGDAYDVVLDAPHAYTVWCLREPDDSIRQMSPDVILDEMSRRGAIDRDLREADERHDVPAGRCRGREEKTRVGTRAGVNLTFRRYVAGDRAYVLIATSTDDPTGRQNATRFLESFRGAVCDAAPR